MSIFFVPEHKQCLTCLQWLAVQHAALLLPVPKVYWLYPASFALKIQVLASGDIWVEHVFADGAKEHAVELEEVSVLLQWGAVVIELIVILFFDVVVWELIGVWFA